MAHFKRLDVLNEMVNTGLIPVFYHKDFEVAKKVIEACAAGGARAIEFTNRGDNAYRVFSDLVQYFASANPKVILGVGSVLDPVTGGLFIASGANFVVGSALNPELARVCNRHKIPYSPGCGSASEISQAEELGVEVVKIFPGDSVGGPKFVKSILGPTPWTRIMPTGGVEASRESIEAWFKAGVAAVGMGSNLIRKEWVEAGDYAAITDLTRKLITWIGQARGKSLYEGIEHVGLYEGDEAKAVGLAEWYRDLFGFGIDKGKSSMMVNKPNRGSIEVMKKTFAGGCHIAVKVLDFDEAVADLKVRGVALEEPIVKPGFRAVYLKDTDPAGNLVHLVWRDGSGA